MLMRTKFNVFIDVWSKMSNNKRKSRAIKIMKTSSTSLDLIVQMMLINTPKRKKNCADNFHSMNKYMIVNSLHY